MAGEPTGTTDLPDIVPRTVARLGRTVSRALEGSGLTPAGYRLLAHLDAGDRSAAILAEKLAVSRPTITATTRWLEDRSLVSRHPDPADGRRQAIRMTDAGIRALRQADALVAARLGEVLGGLPAADRRRVLDAILLLAEALDRHRLEEHTRRLAEEQQ